jgi:hypothetical protein
MFGGRPNVKNEDLIPESFMKISSSSLDFHKKWRAEPCPGERYGCFETEKYQSMAANIQRIKIAGLW